MPSNRRWRTAAAPGRRSIWSSPAGHWPSSAAAATCSVRTWRQWRQRCCGTGSCSATRASPTASPRTTSCVASSKPPRCRGSTSGMAVSSDERRRRRGRLPNLEVLGRLRWPVLGRLGFHTWGDERSRSRGPGVEFADVREYQFGEDARLIDWNLTARSDRIFVRESHPDRGLDAWLIVDASASLDWGTALTRKREAALDMPSAASSLIARHGSRVGAIVFDAKVRRILPPVAGRRGRLHLVGSLDADMSAPPAGAPPPPPAALSPAGEGIPPPGPPPRVRRFLP